MSRTIKDKPSKVRFPELDHDYRYYKIEYESDKPSWRGDGLYMRTAYMPRKGVLTKKRKEIDAEWHWMSTPSWWTRLMMNRPQRRRSRLWEHEIVKLPIEVLEEVDAPNVGKKPQIYFY